MTKKKFQIPKEGQTFFEMQEGILKFWKDNRIFERSVEERPEEKTYSFYDGPPFITGTPHYATLLPSIAKDVIPRFKTMKGYRVRRVWGWDCHGLPAETKVEKQLGLKSKKDIEAFGVDKFVAACRKYVSEVSSEWPWYIDNIGRWVDMESAYRTMDRDYMESVIWAFKKLYDDGLIYRGMRSSLYCVRCATPLSKFEITMDDGFYRDVSDLAIAVKFKIKGENKHILAWTTTPWTLPSNAALAIDKKESYVEIEFEGDRLIFAEKALSRFVDDGVKIIRKIRGDELLGIEYEPLYRFFPGNTNDYKVYSADFVTMEDGTGVVHVAPSFGEVDFLLGKEKGLSMFMTIDEEGNFVKEVLPWAHLQIKKANSLIVDDLKKRGLLFNEGVIVHSYPFCYRCETPLIYKAQEAWYLNIEKLRAELIETNQSINWIPSHFKTGRFEFNLKNAPDWCLSRSRYWGSPIPVWECEKCGELKVLGSLEEIEKISGKRVDDLHRPDIDQVTFPCSICGGNVRRVKEVLDCWFESGMMPYAQWHYPFENQIEFEKNFPADFIVEYTGQLRGWFYCLHVLANALKKSKAFKNVVVTGVLKGTDGRKMSKSFGNYPDPKATIQKYGGESLRLFFMSNPIMKGEDAKVSEEEIKEYYQKVMSILWNSYKYFITYANLHDWNPSEESSLSDSTNVLDRWILGELEITVQTIDKALETYDYPAAARTIRPFVENLSTWYIRLSRERFVQGDKDALQTLHAVLVRFALAAAPLLPFTSETIYQNLVCDMNLNGEDSVHLCAWPEPIGGIIEDAVILREKMEEVVLISHIVNSLRKEKEIPLRQPLSEMFILGVQYLMEDDDYVVILKREGNVKHIRFGDVPTDSEWATKNDGRITVFLNTTLTEELREEGLLREVIRGIQGFRKQQELKTGELVDLEYTSNAATAALINKEKEKIMKLTYVKSFVRADLTSVGATSEKLFLKIIHPEPSGQ